MLQLYGDVLEPERQLVVARVEVVVVGGWGEAGTGDRDGTGWCREVLNRCAHS